MKKLILLFVLISLGAQAQFADKLKVMKAYSGYFNFYLDESTDKIYLEVNKLNEEFLYAYSLRLDHPPRPLQNYPPLHNNDLRIPDYNNA